MLKSKERAVRLHKDGGFVSTSGGFFGNQTVFRSGNPWNGHAWAHSESSDKKKSGRKWVGRCFLVRVSEFGTVRQKITNEPWMDE